MVEDEVATIEVCKTYIAKLFSNVEWIGDAKTLQDAELQLQNLTPDILLLDVSLPDGNSFELLQKLPTHNSQIIFITAHEDFALKAIKVKAADYLLKPILVSELSLAIENAIEKIQKNKANQLSKLNISTTQGIEFLNKKDIVYIKAEGNYADIYTTAKLKSTATKTLKQLEALLGNNFLRTHQSYIVNTQYIVKYNKSDSTLLLEQGIEIPISKSKKEEVLNTLIR